MAQSKKHSWLLFIGLLLLLTVFPRDIAKADVGLPPAPISTILPEDIAKSDTDPNFPNATPSVPFSLILGIGFISTAVVLIIIAVKRGEN